MKPFQSLTGTVFQPRCVPENNLSRHNLYDPLFFFAEPELALLIALVCFASRHKWAKGQLKKRMECYPAGVESRNTGWCGDNHPLCRALPHIMEKGCFAGARFTRQKNITVSVLNKVVGKLQFMVCGGHSFPDHAHS